MEKILFCIFFNENGKKYISKHYEKILSQNIAMIRPESINMEPVAVGLYGLGVYVCISVVCNWNKRTFLWILFFTGAVKHISAILLGLQDYLCQFHFMRVSRNLSETGIGKNREGKEFREWLEFMVVGALVEGALFLLIGSGIYYGLGWKKGGNVFVTGMLVYLLAETAGLNRVLCMHNRGGFLQKSTTLY